MKWLDKYQDGGQVFNTRQKRGIELQIKDYKQQVLDKKELQTKGTLNNPKSIKYKNLAPKKEEIKKHTPQSTSSKAWEVATHPMTAAGYVARNESLPDNFSKGEINAHETATNLINPFFYADESKNFVKNVVTGHPLDAGINALNVLPVAAEYRAMKYLNPINKELKAIEKLGAKQGLSEFEIAKKQMEQVGITTNQRKAYTPIISDLAEKYVTPYGYIGAGGESKIKEIYSNIVNGGWKKNITSKGALYHPEREDALNLYLGKPQTNGSFSLSDTAPSLHKSYSPKELQNIDIYNVNTENISESVLPAINNSLNYNALNSEKYLDILNKENIIARDNVLMGGYNKNLNPDGLQYNDIWDLAPPITYKRFVPSKVSENSILKKLFYKNNGPVETPKAFKLPVEKILGKPFMAHGNLPLTRKVYIDKLKNAALNTRNNYLDPETIDVMGKEYSEKLVNAADSFLNKLNKYQDGGKVTYGTPEYTDAYNKGEVITKEGIHSPILLDEVTVRGKKKSKNWLEQYADKIVEENKDAGPLGAIIGTPLSAITSLPQMLATKLMSGKMQRPSEAMDIQNPVGAFTMDAIADPLNLIGVGELSGLSKIAKEQALVRIELSKESGLLSNAHKINPFAFKPKQGKYYRQVFGENINPLVTKSMQINNDPKGVQAFLDGVEDVVYTNKGEKMIDVYNLKTKESLPYFNKNQPFYPRSKSGVNETLIENKNNLIDYKDFYPSKIKSMSLNPEQSEAATKMFGEIRTLSPFSETGHNISNYNVYKKDWLQGYKEVPKSTSKFNSEIDWGKWNKEIPENTQLIKEYNAIDYRKNPLSDKEKEMYQWFDEQMRFDKLPETTNKQSIEVLDNFKQRIKTPEGQKRLKELGITEEQLLQDLKIVEDPNTYGYYRGLNKNTIAINPNHPLPKKVVRHEIEHGVQNALRKSKINKAIDGTPAEKLKALEINTTEIDDILSELTLRREGTPNKVWNKINTNETVNINDYKSLINNKQNATDYFLTGSDGAEKSAFLGEVQQYMMDAGKIPKNSYVQITPEMVKETMIDAMFDEKTGGKYLRLFNIIKADPKNYEIISKGLNKMLSITPLIGAGAYMQNKEYKNGGAIGNNGMFDMTNPNIYKSVLPIGLGLGAASQLEQKKNGGIIKDDNGYWNPKNWGKTVEINSPDITMEGVNQPLLGTSKQTGEKRIMFPGENHKFANTKQVIETPLKGKWLNKYN